MSDVRDAFVLNGFAAAIGLWVERSPVTRDYFATTFPVDEDGFAMSGYAQTYADGFYTETGAMSAWGLHARPFLDRLFLEAVKQWREKSEVVDGPAVIYLASSDMADFDVALAVAFSDPELAREYAQTRFGEYGFVEHMTIESNVGDRLAKDKARLVSRLRDFCSSEDLALLNL